MFLNNLRKRCPLLKIGLERKYDREMIIDMRATNSVLLWNHIGKCGTILGYTTMYYDQVRNLTGMIRGVRIRGCELFLHDKRAWSSINLSWNSWTFLSFPHTTLPNIQTNTRKNLSEYHTILKLSGPARGKHSLVAPLIMMLIMMHRNHKLKLRLRMIVC
jgi:hypothetical protein